MLRPLLIFTIITSVSPSVFADKGDTIRIARYSVETPTPTDSQKNPLNVIVQINLPSQVKTVGDAIEFLLRRSGYTWSETNVSRRDEFFDLALPAIHRDLGPVTLDQALQTLVGSSWTLRVNERRRLVGFFDKERALAAIE